MAPDARSAVADADVVITCGPMGGGRAVLERSWLRSRCLVLPIDYDAMVGADVSRAADQFVVDDVAQYESFVARGSFPGWAEPDGSLGRALLDGAGGELRLVCSLGVGSIDAAIAGEVWRRQRASGEGLRLR